MSALTELEELLLDSIRDGESLGWRAENREYSEEKLKEHEEDWAQVRAAWFAEGHGGKEMWER